MFDKLQLVVGFDYRELLRSGFNVCRVSDKLQLIGHYFFGTSDFGLSCALQFAPNKYGVRDGSRGEPEASTGIRNARNST